MRASHARGYVSDCDHTLPRMEALFNACDRCAWQLLDSTRYGDYPNSIPGQNCRVRICDTAQITGASLSRGGRPARNPEELIRAHEEGRPPPPQPASEPSERYRITLEIGPGADIDRPCLDRVVVMLLESLGARAVVEWDAFER